MTDMADSSTGSRLFVRQSSGLVRDVSVTNALFFNVAAFVGVGLTLYTAFLTLAFVPVWRFAGLSEYGWAAIISGLFFIPLSLIFASLVSVMPRSGGDYVFTSRIVHPTSVRFVLLKRNSMILATPQLPQRSAAPMLAPRQMNVRAVRLP